LRRRLIDGTNFCTWKGPSFMATARPISRIFLIAVIVTITIGSISMAAQNPAGLWKLNEGSGGVAFDSSGSGHTAYLSSGINWTNGSGTWAISGNASQRGYVTIPPIDLTGTKAVSVAFWVKRTYTTSGGSALFEAGQNYLQSDTGFALLPDDEACHGIQAVLRGNEGTTANCYSQPSSGVWHHLAIVYDKSQTGGNAVAFYVDGALQNPSWNVSSATNTNNFGNDPVYLLSRGGTAQFSSGTISDFRIYGSPLTGEQVQQIYDDTNMASPAPIGYVQGNYADPQTMQSTVNVGFNSAQNTGDLNVVVVGWKDSTATIRQVTDSKGNVYTRAVGPTVINGIASQSIYYAKNIVGAGAGTNTISVTFSTSARHPDIRIAEYSGADPTNPIDVTAANSGNGRTSSSGSARTTNASDLILGANLVQSITSGPGTGFTKRLLSAPQGNIAEDQMVSTTGRYAASAPIMPSARWIMQMIAIRTPSSPVLVSISVTPTNPSISVGAHQQFTATGAYSDGSHQDLTTSATWTSSSPSIATISSTGLATGVAAGSTTIKAASDSINGTTNLTVTAGGSFTIGAAPSSLTVAQGFQGITTITTTVNNGFNNPINLSASGMPSGTTVAFSPTTIPAPGSGSSVMTISVGSSTPNGTYPITVAGNGGGVQQTTTVTLTVGGAPGFSVTASPGSISVMQGMQGNSTITTTISNGFNNSVSLSATGMPTGTTVNFSPVTIPAPGSGSSLMTISVGATTHMGTYPITVTASGGGIHQTTTVNLTVTAQVALSWTASTSPGTAGYNIYRAMTSGGPYTKINTSLDPNTTFNDQAVQDGYTYYYVTTAVNGQGMESTYSNEASAFLP
jgi:hypothetical protein